MTLEELNSNVGNRFLLVDTRGLELNSTFKILEKINDTDFSIKKEKPFTAGQTFLNKDSEIVSGREPFTITIDFFKSYHNHEFI